jgi:hypothetical protein
MDGRWYTWIKSDCGEEVENSIFNKFTATLCSQAAWQPGRKGEKRTMHTTVQCKVYPFGITNTRSSGPFPSPQVKYPILLIFNQRRERVYASRREYLMFFRIHRNGRTKVILHRYPVQIGPSTYGTHKAGMLQLKQNNCTNRLIT